MTVHFSFNNDLKVVDSRVILLPRIKFCQGPLAFYGINRSDIGVGIGIGIVKIYFVLGDSLSKNREFKSIYLFSCTFSTAVSFFYNYLFLHNFLPYLYETTRIYSWWSPF